MDFQKSLTRVFNSGFNQIDKWIVDIDEYHNGTGYFDELAKKQFDSLEPRKFEDKNGRRGIVFPLRSHLNMMPNLVYFERYSGDNPRIECQHEPGKPAQATFNELNTLFGRLRNAKKGRLIS